MQANCPHCAQRIVIDESRVPDRPFSVKCPKCQQTARFPGRGAAAGATPPAPIAPEPPEPASVEPPPGEHSAPVTVAPEDMRLQLMAQLRREMTLPTADAGSSGRALVTLPDRSLAGAVTVMLTRQGFVVDTIDESDEAAHLIDHGIYALAVVAKTAGAAGKETPYQRLTRLSPDNRRRVFLVLIGDDLKSGDSLQAFTSLADLVLSSRDASSADVLVRNTVSERARLYQVYVDARVRHEGSAG